MVEKIEHHTSPKNIIAMGSRSICLLILLVIFIPSSVMSESSDIKSLFTLRHSIAEEKGFLRSWFDSETPPCSWLGITCSGRSVVAIDLSSMPLYVRFPSCIGAFESLVLLNLSGCGFTGELPDTLGNLQRLQYLELNDNQLTGHLPDSLYTLKMLKEMVLDNNLLHGQLSPAIAQLQHLTKLSISGNSISSGIPTELGSLQNLEFLDLHMNSLNGSIPAAFRNLSQLLHLDLSQNNLSGLIFSGISSLVNLMSLDLSSNNFVGPIPREIGQLENLRLLILGQNAFTGSIPEEIGTIPWSISGLVSLEKFDISENHFDAELPTSIGLLGNLTQLIAKNAGLRGSIPKELSNCKKITLINLSFNAFTGSIPEELAELETVISFSVEGNKLSGNIPDWIRNWANARSISLGQNLFSGPLPLQPLQHLLSFSAETNRLSGSVPFEMCQDNSLQTLILHDNNLTGSIEETFKGCTNLTELNLLGNHLHGEIPGYLAELPLVSLELSLNNFTGMLPDRLWESSTLLQISLSNNQITGQIPDSIGRLSSLQRLQIDNNYLEGPIPQSVGYLQNLTILSLHGNGLSGNIPIELFNCRNLATLDLSSNNLTGHVPRAISNLTLLNSLILSYNQLSGAIPAEICVGFENEVHPDSEFVQHNGLLDLSYNRLTGQIPAAIKKCSMLMVLNLQGNLLNGTIPSELGELTNLTSINLSSNGLVGPMLPWSAPLVQLQGLILSNNHLNGTIPVEIGQVLPKISMLDLSGNVLTGSLPQSLLCNKYLNRLDVSNNNLSGKILFFCPMDGESSSSLLFFNSSSNHFSGTLDEPISNFTQLSSLDIHNNSLTGSLPSALSDLSFLNYLDLSSNDFYGVIPCGICNIFGLTFANFSGNHIDMYSSLDCAAGVLLVFYLRHKLSRNSSLVIAPAGKAKATVEPTSSDGLLGRKSREPLSINLATFQHSLLRVTIDDILKATENFSKEHIIGDGGFGTVYRAALPEGRRVAIKRLHGGHQFQGDREFLAEMETIGKVKHPNLVPLLGYCVCGDERFLIYEYMENGSLEIWLRNRADAVEALGWPDRLKICLGSAHGLAFLHEGFVPHIIHRDMKSRNILLDVNFEPRVSDFGLARIISACETHVSTDIAGTCGYIPPEYGQTMKSSTKGDVYSFGVVMLELLTGRPPTGQEDLEGGGNLVGWVRWVIARGARNELFDPCLPVSGVWREQMVRVLGIGRRAVEEAKHGGGGEGPQDDPANGVRASGGDGVQGLVVLAS
ncbi:leucine-rich repeat receptor protein kinase MSP1-like [Aegilops tauschii subsp. strangulata]|uniref:leucine-rich repeat receptor protein kinase MSP1-like n=1 Tax=Aegilops tauschii subsp. strangulata TaxID=200361 RepID=UPI003CC8BDF8